MFYSWVGHRNSKYKNFFPWKNITVLLNNELSSLFYRKCSKIFLVFIEPFFNGSNPSLNSITNRLPNSIRMIRVCVELRN